MTDAEKRIRRARKHLLQQAPFYGVIALQLGLIERKNGTMATDGENIFYCAAWVNKLSNDELKGVVAHEVLHVSNGHHIRMGARDLGRWNQACDEAINPLLIEEGFVLPDGALNSPQFRGMSAEAIYRAILKSTPQSHSKNANDNSSSNNNSSGERGAAQSNNQSSDNNTTEYTDSAKDDVSSDTTSEHNNSHNQSPHRIDAEQSDNSTGQDPGQCGGILPPTRADGKTLNQAIAEADAKRRSMVTQAEVAAKTVGIVPGAMSSIVKALRQSNVDWKDELRPAMTSLAKNDYSWLPPSNRLAHLGLLTPAFKSQCVNHIIIAIDSSASLNDRDLSLCLSGVSEILEDIRPNRITLLCCDRDIRAVYDLTYDDLPLDLSIKGRGGTAFEPVFDYVQKQIEQEPDCLIYFSDMEVRSWPDEPSYPVYWISTSAHSSKWGTTIFLN